MTFSGKLMGKYSLVEKINDDNIGKSILMETISENETTTEEGEITRT